MAQTTARHEHSSNISCVELKETISLSLVENKSKNVLLSDGSIT